MNRRQIEPTDLWERCCPDWLSVLQVDPGAEDGSALDEEGAGGAAGGLGPPEALPEGGQLPALLEERHRGRHVQGASWRHLVSPSALPRT